MNLELILDHPWFGTWAAALVAVIVALIAHRLGGMLLLRITRATPVLHAIVIKSRAPAKAVLPLLALQTVWQAAPDDLRWIDSVRHLNGLLMITATTWLAARIIAGFAQGVLERHPVDVEDNMGARRIHTQTRVLSRIAMSLVIVIGASMVLMTFPGARQVGASLLASAGVVGLIAGFAAKPVFSNMIAGLQLALTQPIRLDDVLIVEGEWGRVEEITGTYVVLRIWDERRLIIPLQYFIEKPFQNWTRSSAQLMGSVFFHVDYGMPLAPLRKELERIVHAAPQWDRRFFNLVVTDATERTMQLRVLCTAASSGLAWDLRCVVREGLIDFMQREYPQFLPRLRIEGEGEGKGKDDAALRGTAVHVA
ncbi:mechanosensitive ion channel family protein [Cupriavidus oxalaticus]|jgi:small-conductance mechanosensitive channel|uniref:Mechanosensitive ion channel n=1 Tax=Cupriavidus oxalaticus TaxID=96344 RepID=A0A375FTT1_9BURK|nr:mechanosensitive ion channel domain-containing protein [Cupriavidus oxalaticus]QRQ88803.1 mechanosensitive ion channel [Cupriavidus oxalaticus]QRQ92871.1 mechanosensitive ion channel [Cupriavidus oxalaticus]WQD81477.1 mechanosensitive ion channel [Cupriavidus oxalaticus]SPC07421.1 Mechanosensitive ion channel protein MscS [Cupriavidus oxalaticus]SPC12791.1 Mechanosensitive ion channel protein MscS [Cupriavidus oxalaticus]